MRITGCTARDNVHTGIYITGFWDGQRRAYANQNIYIGHCLAVDNLGDPDAVRENRSGSGIFLEGTDGGIIEYCQASGNGRLNRGQHGGPVGIWATVSTRVAIQFCHSHHNRTGGHHDGGGFCLDGGVSRSVMQHNLSHDNDGSGFGLFEYAGAPPAEGNVIHENISRNDGRKNAYAGIHVWDGGEGIAHIQIYNNEVSLAPATGPGSLPPRAIWLQTAVRDARVTNNCFIVEPGVRLIDVAQGQQGLLFRDNAYEAPVGGAKPEEPGAVAIDWEGQSYVSLADWRKATGEKTTVLSARAADEGR